MAASYPGFADEAGGTHDAERVLPSIAMLKKREILPPAFPSSSGFTLEEAMAAVRAVYRNPATGRFVVGKRGESLAELRKRVRAKNAAAAAKSASRKR